jgi:hypothetical protein
MSVIKSKRGLSKLEFYHTARKLRKDLTELLRRDFGIHARGNAKNVDPSLPDDYFDEDIADFSRNIKTLLRNLIWNITAANTIYASNEDELRTRRGYMNAAIINCQQLLQEMQYCEDVLPVAVSKFLPYVDTIGFEITLLKGWRKSDNKLLDKIRK